MKLYPLKFKPVFQEKIWGGQKLKTYFSKDIPAKKTGESWEISAHPAGISKVLSGELSGKGLDEIFHTYYQEIMGELGNILPKKKFPLLIKILDANDKLSVQVHPGNEYALKHEGEPGKTEMWYIIDAKKGSSLIIGLKKDTNREKISQAIKNGDLEKHLNRVPVKAGDVFFIPSGTIHAIEEGIFLAEIQQNSDTTYRVYDWNRKNQQGQTRELHINKALNVINFDLNPDDIMAEGLVIEKKSYQRGFITASPHFITEKIKIKKNYNLNTRKQRFYILMGLKGSSELYCQGIKYNFNAGESILIPACLPEVKLQGNMTLLKTYLPDSKEFIIEKLKKLGFQLKEILDLPGIKSWDQEKLF